MIGCKIGRVSGAICQIGRVGGAKVECQIGRESGAIGQFFIDVCTDSNLVQNEAKEEDCPSPNDPQLPQEGEPDFYETKCHWKDCTSEFDTQEDLVKVSDVH